MPFSLLIISLLKFGQLSKILLISVFFPILKEEEKKIVFKLEHSLNILLILVTLIVLKEDGKEIFDYLEQAQNI